MTVTFPQPLQGAPGEVVINSIPMQLALDENGNIVQYDQNDPQRFADKLSIGDLKYGDFNTYENAFAVGQFDGGYGLDRYANLNNESDGIGLTKESFGVDTRFGPAFLAGRVNQETLPNSIATPVWVGEFTPSAGTVTGARWVAIAGKKVWYRGASGIWTDTTYVLPANALQDAITVVGGSLIIGFGSANTARYLTSLDGVVGLSTVQDTGANALYVFAATSDRASVYIAGGTASTNTNTVLSAAVTATTPPQAFGLAASAFSCGGTDRVITSIAPGGGSAIGSQGQALLFVCSNKELGVIADLLTLATSVYFQILPFDSSLSTNGQGMRWAQGSGSDAQRGPVTLVFNRDRSPWSYSPSIAEARNLAPWSKHGFRPPTIRGKATCFQGTARWLYYGITRGSDGHSWILCRDSATNPTSAQVGATVPLFDLGILACQTLGLTSLFGTNPLLFMGYGNNLASVILPLDGESPLDDTLTTFGASGTLTMPDIDHGFPDEDKVEFTIRLIHDKVVPNSQDIQVQVALDGGAFTTLGAAGAGSSSSLSFTSGTVSKRITPQFVLSTTDLAKTPILIAFSVRASINPVLYREWFVVCSPKQGTQVWGGEDRQNVYSIIAGFWASRRNGLPFPFVDVWQDTYTVRLLRFRVHHVRHPIAHAPEVQLYFHLLEVSFPVAAAAKATGTFLYGASGATYGVATYG